MHYSDSTSPKILPMQWLLTNSGNPSNSPSLAIFVSETINFRGPCSLLILPRDYFLSLDPVPELTLSFHSAADMLLYPFGYARDTFPDNVDEIVSCRARFFRLEISCSGHIGLLLVLA